MNFGLALLRFALVASRILDYASRAAAADVRYPSVFIQYGPPRTASTFQWKVLHIAAMLLRARDRPVEPISNPYIEHETDLVKALEQDYSYFLLKMHPLKSTTEMIHNRFSSKLVKRHRSMMENAWIFSTWQTVSGTPSQKDLRWIVARSLDEYWGEKTGEETLAAVANRIKFVQETSTLETHGRYIVWQYKDILGLSHKEVEIIIEYLRYWEVLRQCCGDEMSDDYRAMLQRNSSYLPHHAKESASYPACEMYDIESVQRALQSSKAMQILHPHLDNGFPNCSQANNYIATHPDSKLFDRIPYVAPVFDR